MLIHPWDAALDTAEWQDWRAKAGGPDEDGVPTSYYTAVQLVCRPTVVDDPEGTAEILAAQLADLQPEGGHAEVDHRERVSSHLEERGKRLDARAATQQRRRLAAIGDWQNHRDGP